MNIYAISDLHLSNNCLKPMDIFGPQWEGHFEKIKIDWLKKVKDKDIVLMPGDLSWAMKLEESLPDLNEIASLAGRKVILRGNHDYWWGSYNKLLSCLPDTVFAVQNNCIRINNILLAGSRGWPICDEKSDDSDKKIYDRELIRLRMSLDAMARVRQDNDIVIGMMHFPPYQSDMTGSAFTELFREYNVSKVVYGHLHSPVRNIDKVLNLDGVSYYLCSCDLVNYRLVKII